MNKHRGSRPPGPPRGGDGPLTMPEPRPVQYFDGDNAKALNPALLEQAQSLAQDIRSVHASQLRRFYADVTAFERKLMADSMLPDSAVQSQMAMLKARAAYAYARKAINRDLLGFFVSHAASVKNRQDFLAFRQIFEALIAFHKFYEA